MLMCDFIKDASELYWNHTSAWAFSCKFTAYFQKTCLSKHLWRAAIIWRSTPKIYVWNNHFFVSIETTQGFSQFIETVKLKFIQKVSFILFFFIRIILSKEVPKFWQNVRHMLKTVKGCHFLKISNIQAVTKNLLGSTRQTSCLKLLCLYH